MAKMKTHSGCKKRFRKNGNGKIKRAKAYKRHHAWAKDRKQVRQLGEGVYFEGTQSLNIKKLMPY